MPDDVHPPKPPGGGGGKVASELDQKIHKLELALVNAEEALARIKEILNEN